MDNQVQTIKSLLSKVSDIRIKYEKIEEIAGEKFNVFRILNLTTYEVRTHSAFLCELLNPKGSHGYKDIFLKLFLDQQRVKFAEHALFLQRFNNFDTSCSTASAEDHIGFKDNDGTEGGRIDLLIKDVKNRAVIIENKIYAKDQPKQLVRYNNAFKDAPIFYLTLDGSLPMADSSGELKKSENYECISYKTDIIEWLEKCRKEAVTHSLIRETITQYINLIKYLTGKTMNAIEKNEIAGQIIAQNDYLKSFLQIQQSDVMSEVKNQLMELFRSQLKEVADKYNMRIEWDPKFNIGQESDCNLYLNDESIYGYYIAFGFLGSFNNLTYGIFSNKRPYLEEHRRIVSDKKGYGLVNLKTNNFTNWLWLGKFEEPLVNWNSSEPWLAIRNGTLIENLSKKIKDLLEIINSLS